ncbi:MAG: T9SS type A sorting domain-containing protein [Flavobacteriales bacterium]|nr:T9SS type A sorting domain-containing protein [Flavobacteriales bacterium]
MWKEITVNPNANLVVQNYTIIEDAEQAIHWIDGGAVIINSSIFNRNGAGVHLATNFSNTVATNVVVTNTIFTCRDFPASFYQTSFSAGSFASLKNNLFNNNLILYPYGSLIAPAPANTRSLYGVKTKGLEATIGSSGLLKNRNLFDYLDFGIHASQNANLTAVNNAFANLSGYGIKSTIIGVGIFAEKKGTFITIGGNNTKDGNSFKNCYRGANITDYNTINFINNSITNTSTSPTFSPPTYNIGHYGLAIFSTAMQYSNIHLNYNIHKNNISNNAIGVYINSIYSSIVSQNIQLTQNNLDVSGSGTYCNQGVWMQSLSGSTANVGDVFVSGNTVKGSNMQALLFENVNNMLRVDLNPELSVLNNTSPSKQAIRLNSCNGAMVTNNTVATTNNTSIPSGNLGGFITGIYLNNSPSCIVTCNTANYLDVCVLFDQPNSMAYFANNSMNKAQYGLVLANGAIIGQQGDATHPSGNQWGRNDINNITLNHTYTYLTPNANTNSPLYCKPNAIPNCTAGGVKTFPCSNGGTVFSQAYQISLGGLNTATGSSPGCTARPGNPLANARALLHEADSGNGNAVDKFLKKRQAFRLIKTDTTGVLMADSELNTFYNQEQTQSIGKLSTTNELIGNNNLVTAQSTNSSIIPTNVAEHNTKAVNEIWLQSMLDTAYVLTTADSSTLYTIGNICIQQGGDATVLARSLLTNFTQTALTFNDCLELPFAGNENRMANQKNGSTNLILNGSLEDGVNYYPPEPWLSPQYGDPDLFPNINIQTGPQTPKHGLRFVGGFYFMNNIPAPTPPAYTREPVIAKTSVTLNSGMQYCLSYYISLADTYNCAVNRSDAYFSPTPMDPTLGTPPYLQYVQPHVMADSTVFYTDKENWTKIEGCYIASGGENYITFGNLHLDNETDTLCSGVIPGYPDYKGAYYYMDNFSLEEITPVDAGADVSIANGDSVIIGNNLDSASSYVWSPNYFIDDVNALNPTVNPPVTTTYYVTKTQCSVVTTDSVTVVVGGVGIEAPKSPKGTFSIYPNPNNGTFTIKHNLKNENYALEIVDIMGKVVHRETLKSGNQQEIKTQWLNTGIYFVNIKSETGELVYSSKMSVMK